MTRKVALLIGVSEYGEGIPSLSAPLNDVAVMKRVLENPQMGGFDTVKKLINPDVPAMQKAVQQIFANCHKDDLVLLFFSGHGITDDNNRLYLATKGTSKDFYKATSVPASFIQDVSLESYAKRQVIVLDCCYSGAFAEGWQAKSLGLNLEKELGAEGRVVLTSSTATQTSFQQEDEELSLYTQYLIEGMETGAADRDEDGKIYAHELHEYAKAKVQEVKPKQKPEIIIDKEGFNILLSQAPINDPELDFRKLVEKYATEGQITVAGNYILRVKRQELGITEEKSNEIVNEVLTPYRQRIANIKLYQQAFTEAVAQNYPLTERLINELQDLENFLGLEDKDIAQVKEEVQAEKEAESQQITVSSNLQQNQISAKESIPEEANQNFVSKLLSPFFQMRAKDFYNRGVDKHNKGDYQAAIADYTKAIELKPNDSSAYYNRGVAYGNLEDYQSAIADYDKAIKLKPDDSSAYFNRGAVRSNLEDYQVAIADYDKAIKLKSKNSLAYFNRGVARSNLEDYQVAIADYDKAIKINQNWGAFSRHYFGLPTAYYRRGFARYEQKDYQAAIADYDKAIKLKPDYADAYYWRGVAYGVQEDYQVAIADFTKAIKLKPDDADAYHIKGFARCKQEDYQAAIGDFNKAIKLKPDFAKAYNNRGITYDNLEDYQAAIADYTKAIDLKPDYANAYYNRGNAHKNLKEHHKATEDYQKAADIYQKQGNTVDYQDALNQIKKLQQ